MTKFSDPYASFHLTVYQKVSDSSISYLPLDKPYVDDDIIDVNGAHIEKWHRDLYKVFRGLGIYIISFELARSDDFMFMRQYQPDLNIRVTKNHFIIKVTRYIFSNTIKDRPNQEARMWKRLKSLEFVGHVEWRPNYRVNREGVLQDQLFIEIDLKKLDR